MPHTLTGLTITLIMLNTCATQASGTAISSAYDPNLQIHEQLSCSAVQLETGGSFFYRLGLEPSVFLRVKSKQCLKAPPLSRN